MNYHFDLKSLQLFVSVVELQSLTKAAEREHIAPSAISKRIGDLEIALDVPLLHRQARGVEPTAAGLTLLNHARRVLRDVGQLVGELADYAKGAKGHVRIAANKSSLVEGLSTDVGTFMENHPNIKIDLEEDSSPNIIKNVRDGRIDLGVFTFGHADDVGIETFEYRRDQLIVILPRNHALSGRPALRFADVQEQDIVNLDSLMAWNHLLQHAAENVKKALRIRYRVSGFDVACALVAAGLGIAIAPSWVLKLIPDSRLQGITLDEPWAKRQHLICVRSTELLPAPARAMLNHLTATMPSRPLHEIA